VLVTKIITTKKRIMKKFIYLSATSLLAGIFILSSCNRDVAPPPPPQDYSFVEDFDSLESTFRKGWVAINNSKPLGEMSWLSGEFADGKKGMTNPIGAQSYTYSGQDYALCTFHSCGSDTAGFMGKKPYISAWLISPSTIMKNGDKIIFYTRCYQSPASFPDRLQVRLNAISNSANVGADTSTVGDFTMLLKDINPTLSASGYPGTWTKYEVTLAGLAAPLQRRFAFRYYVPDGGVIGSNSFAIGIDSVAFVSSK
jgi:hypothetical protein